MKSFKDYVNYRSKMSVLEMAAEPIVIKDAKGKERKIVEVRKTHIFMDQDDIDYLKNFPPEVWVQALQKRYGELLHKAHEAKEQGKTFNDSNLPVVVKHNRSILEFRVDNAKINDLYERLSGDTDDETYSRLRLKDQEGRLDPDIEQKYLRGRTHSAKGNRLGPYAFNFSDYTRKPVKTKKGKQKEIGIADGWVEPDLRTIERVLESWLGGIEDGWYDDKISDKEQIAKVNFEKNGIKKVPVERQKTWVAGKDFIVKKGTIKEIRSWIPKIFPSMMVQSNKFARHELLKNASKLISDDIQNGKFEDYMSIVDLSSPDLINQNKLNEILQKINKIKLEKSKEEEEEEESNEKSSKHSKSRKLNSELAKLEKIRTVASRIRKNKNRFEKYLKQEISKVENDDEQSKIKAVEIALSSFLSDVVRLTDGVRKRIRRDSDRYGVHHWNIAQYNPRETSPQSNWRGIGTFQPNKQQSETSYSAIVNILGQENSQSFIDHLSNDLNLKIYVKNGILRKLSLTKQNSPTSSVKGIFSKSIKQAIEDNLEEVMEDAYANFINAIGRGSIIDYAKIYKIQVLENNKNPKELLEYKPAKKFIKEITTRAGEKGADYCQSLIQLYERFLDNKYNRDIRPENPWDFKNPSASFMEILEYLFNNKDLIAKLDPRTSHSIHVLKEIHAVSLPFEKEISHGIENDNSKKSSQVNKTQDQKSTNKNIFASLMKRMISGISSIFGSRPTGQQPTGFKPPIKQKPKQDKPSTFLGFKPPWQK